MAAAATLTDATRYRLNRSACRKARHPAPYREGEASVTFRNLDSIAANRDPTADATE